jgi:hypothetical protein
VEFQIDQQPNGHNSNEIDMVFGYFDSQMADESNSRRTSLSALSTLAAPKELSETVKSKPGQ